MKLALVLALLTLALPHTSLSEEEAFSAFFRFSEGQRLDFSAAHPNGEGSKDTISGSAVLHILIPAHSEVAQISVTYGDDPQGIDDPTYSGAVVHRTNHMISIICKFEDDIFGHQTDKVENFVIFPDKGTGLMITHSALGGSPMFQGAADKNPQLPYASAKIFRLHRLKK